MLVGFTHYLVHRNTNMIEPVCYLEDLFTAEAARGKGVVRALIESVCAEARAAGLRRVYWITHAANKPAQRLYVQVGETPGFVMYQQEIEGREDRCTGRPDTAPPHNPSTPTRHGEHGAARGGNRR